MTFPIKALVVVGRVAAMVYGGLILLGLLAANRLMFQPPSASYDGKLAGLQMVPAEDGTQLAVVYLPNPKARHTVFYFHGTAEDIGHNLPLLRELQARGMAVLAFDYRGYGRSGGKPTEDNIYADTRAVLAWAKTQFGLTSEQIIIVGRSVGTGPAVELAANSPVAGLVLISPLASAFRVLTRVKILPFDRFDNLAKAKRVKCPTLIFHGTRDEVIPFADGLKLFAAITAPKTPVWIEGAGHNDIFERAGERILGEMGNFEKALPNLGAR